MKLVREGERERGHERVFFLTPCKQSWLTLHISSAWNKPPCLELLRVVLALLVTVCSLRPTRLEQKRDTGRVFGVSFLCVLTHVSSKSESEREWERERERERERKREGWAILPRGFRREGSHFRPRLPDGVSRRGLASQSKPVACACVHNSHVFHGFSFGACPVSLTDASAPLFFSLFSSLSSLLSLSSSSSSSFLFF